MLECLKISMTNINSNTKHSKDGFWLKSNTTERYEFMAVYKVLKNYTPREILDALCTQVFTEDVNALLVVNNKPLSDTSVPTPQYLSSLGEKIWTPANSYRPDSLSRLCMCRVCLSVFLSVWLSVGRIQPSTC